MADEARLHQLLDLIEQARGEGDTATEQKVIAAYRAESGGHSLDQTLSGGWAPTGSPEAIAARSPVAGNTYGQNMAIGAGQSMHSLYQGAMQDVGMASRQDVQNTRHLDAPLTDAPGAGVGRFMGTAATLLPAAFIPGANTVAGASLIGAGTGLLQPSTGTGETLGNIAGGGVGGSTGILAGRLLGVGYQAGRSAIQPLYAGGQRKIAAGALQSFAGGPAAATAAASVLRAPPNVLAGVQPTTAELANNAGLAQLERQLRNNPEFITAFNQRNQVNRAAMTSALGNIAGTDADMTAAIAARKAASSPLYEAAKDAAIVPDKALKTLLNRPSMESAWVRAKQLAQENGETLTEGKDIPGSTGSMVTDFGSPPTTAAQFQSYSGRAIQYLKMALNDIANTGPQSGMGAHETNAIKSTLGSLNEWISDNVPALRAADTAYANLSKPINQMEVGTALSNRLQPALADFGNNTRLNAASYAAAVRNGDTLAANATGWKSSTLEGVLSPSQMQTVNQVGQQLARRANADELGRAVGSNTSQNIISQNALRNMLGPLGLPQSMVEAAAQSTLGQSLMRPGQWALSAGEPRIMGRLAQAALSPQDAAQLLSQPVGPVISRAVWERQGLAGLTGASISAYLTQ